MNPEDKLFMEFITEKLADLQFHNTGIIDMQPPHRLEFRALRHYPACPRCKGHDVLVKARVYHKAYIPSGIGWKRGQVRTTWYICQGCDKIFSKDSDG